MKLYKYLFYRSYEWSLKTFGAIDAPSWSGLFVVSTLMGINLITIANFIDIIGIAKILKHNTSTSNIIVFANIVLAINYFWLVKNEKYKRIAEEYKDEPKKKRLRNALLLWLFVIISFVAFILAAILSGKVDGLR